MKKNELTIGLVLAFSLGVVLLGVLVGFDSFSRRQPDSSTPIKETPLPVEEIINMPSMVPISTKIIDSEPVSDTSKNILSSPTPKMAPIQVGNKKGEDLEDVLLLYDSRYPTNFDINFCKIAEYYGLLCKKFPLEQANLSDEVLKDQQGNYFKLVGVSASTMIDYPVLLSKEELSLVKNAIINEGMDLLVSNLNFNTNAPVVKSLTNGVIQGTLKPQDAHRDWIISSEAPDITGVFSGQVITSTSSDPQSDFALSIIEPTMVTTLISSEDDSGETYPIFVEVMEGAGSVFLDSGTKGRNLDELTLTKMYYGYYHVSNILPTMLTMHYVLGDEVWHHNLHYANLTIDDPTLTNPFNQLDYIALLKEMKEHNFHTTIAFVPGNWDKTETDVAKLFRDFAQYYSLVQHGNNHDGYEFYKYSLGEDDSKDDPDRRARSLEEQQADILEGLSRLEKLKNTYGIPFDRVMIFPYGISPENTLVLLKKYNYLATINAQDVPLDTKPSEAWDYSMYPAIMDYGDFPVLTRRQPGTYKPFKPYLQPFIFDLFIDKPALFYSHAYQDELFSSGIDAFKQVADQINNLHGNVTWRSLGYILSHLYREKINDDGSLDINMYTNQLFLDNDTKFERVYHISKQDNLNVPIIALTVNGQDFPFRKENDLLLMDLRVPANSSLEILIRYGD